MATMPSEALARPAAGRLAAWRDLPTIARRGFIAACAGEVLLLSAYLAGLLEPALARPLFNIDGEANLAAWWGSLVLICASGAAFAAYLVRRPGTSAWHWLVLALGLLLLSMEEVAGLHEVVHEFVPGVDESTSELWPVIYAPGLIIGVVAMVRASRDMSGSFQSLALTGVTFLALVICLELVALWDGLVFIDIVKIAEEMSEFLGVGLLLLAVTGYVSMRVVIFRAGEDGSPAARSSRPA